MKFVGLVFGLAVCLGTLCADRSIHDIDLSFGHETESYTFGAGSTERNAKTKSLQLGYTCLFNDNASNEFFSSKKKDLAPFLSRSSSISVGLSGGKEDFTSVNFSSKSDISAQGISGTYIFSSGFGLSLGYSGLMRKEKDVTVPYETEVKNYSIAISHYLGDTHQIMLRYISNKQTNKLTGFFNNQYDTKSYQLSGTFVFVETFGISPEFLFSKTTQPTTEDIAYFSFGNSLSLFLAKGTISTGFLYGFGWRDLNVTTSELSVLSSYYLQGNYWISERVSLMLSYDLLLRTTETDSNGVTNETFDYTSHGLTLSVKFRI